MTTVSTSSEGPSRTPKHIYHVNCFVYETGCCGGNGTDNHCFVFATNQEEAIHSANLKDPEHYIIEGDLEAQILAAKDFPCCLVSYCEMYPCCSGRYGFLLEKNATELTETNEKLFEYEIPIVLTYESMVKILTEKTIVDGYELEELKETLVE